MMSLATWRLPPAFAWPIVPAPFGADHASVVQPTADQLGQLAAHLRTHAAMLRAIPIRSIVDALGRVAQRWRNPTDPQRRAVEAALPELAGYSPPMVRHVLDRMVRDWDADVLWARLTAAFGDPTLLDDWQPSAAGLSRAWGPRLTWHVCAGNVPGVAIQSLVDALLVKSPSLLKPATSEPILAAAWVRALVEELPLLSDALAVVWWPGGELEREAAVLSHATAVIANASNSTINDLRRRMPAHVRLLDYGSRISFSAVAREMLQPDELPHLAARLAYDVAMFDQQGCVSPQMIFVEQGGACSPTQLAAALDTHLAAMEQQFPRGFVHAEAAATLRRIREALEWRAMAGEDVASYGPTGGRWMVVVDPVAAFAPGSVSRTIVVRPIESLETLPELVRPLAHVLQSAALAAPDERRLALATQLAAAGITRITTPGQQAWPSPHWHHDGRQPLAALVHWSDVEDTHYR